jgi:hypothetical protein
MKYISINPNDNTWHNCKEEMPTSSTNVEFLDNNGNIISNGHIYIDMSGPYAALREDNVCTWSSFDLYTHWRFLNTH